MILKHREWRTVPDSHEKNMQVLILAGGKGTRIQSISREKPKSLLDVAGRPFIEHQIDLLVRQGFFDLILCVGYLGDQIEDHIGDGRAFGARVRYARESPDRLMGTGGAIVNALNILSEQFMVIYGDSYLPTSYQPAINAFDESGCDGLMCVYKNEGRWDWSNASVRDGKVSFYSKKAKASEVDYIDYGLSIFNRSVFEGARTLAMPLDLAVVQESLVRSGQMAAYEVKDRFFEIGKPEGLTELDLFLRAAERRDTK